ncbi:MAG: hypothetical protein ACSLFD_03605 [Solirubrobacterales bacterium]
MRSSHHAQGNVARIGLLAALILAALALVGPAKATAIETTITSGPQDGELITVDSATFTFSSDVPGATFECTYELRNPFPCTSPVTMKNLERGNHAFGVRAMDPNGPDDSTPDVRKFKVDEPTGPSEECVAAGEAATKAKSKLRKTKARKAKTRKAKKAKAKAVGKAKGSLKKANDKVEELC